MSKFKSDSNTLLQTIGIWFLIAAAWLLYRWIVVAPEWIDELLIKPLIFVLPIIIFLYRQRHQVRWTDLGFRKAKITSVFAWGLGLGILLSLENILIGIGKGTQLNISQLFSGVVFINIIVSLATALSEEVLYRGFILERLWQKYGNARFANMFSSLLFALGHLGIAVFVFRYQGVNLASYILMIMILGYAQGFVYTKTHSVYASTLTHFLWNFSNTLFI